MIAIGQRIRKLRESHGLSQAQVALAIGSKQNYLSLLEHNKRKPSLDTLEALSRVFQCAVGDLFLEGESPLQPPAASPAGAQPETEPRVASIEDTYKAIEGRGEKILAQNTLKRLDRMATLYEVHFTLKEYFLEARPWSAIAQVISQDRVLAVKVWEAGKAKAMEGGKILEGPDRHMPPETGHVETALRFLGETGIQKIVLRSTQAELQDLMAEISLGCPDYDRAFWCHGALTAHAMLKLLGAHPMPRGIEPPPPGVIFRIGLLLDVGMLFMHLEDPQSIQDVWVECTRTPRVMAYARGEWHLYQKQIHALKGAQVMRLARWSDLEVHVTRYHHDPAQVGESHPHFAIVQCAHLADIIASLLVSAPALTLEDLDVDPDAFDAILGRHNPRAIRNLVGEIVTEARADGFNRSWSWPGYGELLTMMVPSRRGGRERGRREDYPRPFFRWLNRNEGRVGEILMRYPRWRSRRARAG